MARKLNILIVEDNTTIREGIVRVVEKSGYGAVGVISAEQAIQSLQTSNFHIIISDYKLPGMTGIELLIWTKEAYPETEVLLITAYGTIELSVQAIQKGAADFLTKPFSPEELGLKLSILAEKVAQKGKLRRVSEENLYLREQLDIHFNFGEIIGDSAAMQPVYRTIKKLSKSDSTVIIYGESGAGKELVARSIHKAGLRKERSFVRVNCGALAEGLLESELFGHEKGSFTGALKQKKGRFELADNGTIFLDEIGDIPLNAQVKLLRLLQEQEFERVGGEETLKVDVRVIAATNKDLKKEIAAGRFREDLYYRLYIIPIYLPSLRERKSDIPLLLEHFIQKMKRHLNLPELNISGQAQKALVQYDWPGNIREFENLIERLAVLCENNTIEVSDLPFGSSEGKSVQLPVGSFNLNESLQTVERQLLRQAMEKSKGVKTEAARLLGIKTSALYYKLEKYKLL